MENWIYLFLAYTAGWLGVLLYIFMNAKKQVIIERKIKDLESILVRKE
jgi:CcmD family protein